MKYISHTTTSPETDHGGSRLYCYLSWNFDTISTSYSATHSNSWKAKTKKLCIEAL